MVVDGEGVGGGIAGVVGGLSESLGVDLGGGDDGSIEGEGTVVTLLCGPECRIRHTVVAARAVSICVGW